MDTLSDLRTEATRDQKNQLARVERYCYMQRPMSLLALKVMLNESLRKYPEECAKNAVRGRFKFKQPGKRPQ